MNQEVVAEARRVEATRALYTELQNHQAHREELFDTAHKAYSASHLDYLAAQFGKQELQMERINQNLMSLELGVRLRSPDAENIERSTSVPWDTHNAVPDNIRCLVTHTYSTCTAGCSCACHATRNYHSWSIPWLEKALGSLSVSYHGTLLWKTVCTNATCLASRNKAPQWLRASYTLPPWLLKVTLSLFLSPGPPTPELLLRVINRLPQLSSPEAFWNLKGIIDRGDLEALKFSIANRLASVHDVHHASGYTALGYAIKAENFEMVKILLHAGADIYQGSVSTAPVSLLLDQMHIGSPGMHRIASLFSMTSVMEAYGYTDLHKIILGYYPLEVAEAIAKSPVLASQVNKPTIAGITPAHLAAIRGRTEHLAALKWRGADLAFRSMSGTTALFLACRNQKSSAARFILDTEMAPGQRTSLQNTPLHAIFMSPTIDPGMWEVADRLLDLGESVDARATCDTTPLMNAALVDSTHSIAYLLSRGANINARDTDGDTALAEAIFSHSPKSVRLLIERGADVKECNNYQRSPLHYLAGAGSEEIIDIFLSTGALARKGLGIDKYAKDKDGLSAVDILNRRPNLPVVLRQKFQRLLDSIPDCNMASNLVDEAEDDCDSASDTSDDEFVDAQEN